MSSEESRAFLDELEAHVLQPQFRYDHLHVPGDVTLWDNYMTQRFVDAWMALPGLLLLLTIMSRAGRGMLQIIIVLGVSGGIPTSRVVRGAVLGVKENVCFQAAQAIGSVRRRSLLRHVLPNMAAPIIINFSINVGAVIRAEAALSFLGFGLPPDIPSWAACSAGRAGSTWR